MDSTKAVKTSGIYLLFSLFQKGAGFLLLPLYTALLSPEQYGVIGTLLALVEFAVPLVSLSLLTAATRMTFKNSMSENSDEAWSTLFTTTVVTTLIGTGLVLLTSPWWMPSLGIAVSFFPDLLLVMGLLLVRPGFNMQQAFWRAHLEPTKVGVGNVALLALTIGFNVYFLAFCGLGVTGFLGANLIAYAVVVTIESVPLISRIGLRFNLRTALRAVRYSAPSIPHQVMSWLLSLSDRYLVYLFLGKSVAGKYLIVYQLASVVGLVAFSITQAFGPWYLKIQEKKPGHSDAVAQFALGTTMAVVSVATMVGLFSKEIFASVIDSRYQDAWPFLPGLAMSLSFQLLHSLFITPVTMNQPSRLLVSTLFGAPMAVILNILLLPHVGLAGAVLANIVGYGFMSVISAYQCKKQGLQRFPFLLMYGVTIVGGAFSMTGAFLSLGDGLLTFAVKAVVFLLMLVGFSIVLRRSIGSPLLSLLRGIAKPGSR